MRLVLNILGAPHHTRGEFQPCLPGAGVVWAFVRFFYGLSTSFQNGGQKAHLCDLFHSFLFASLFLLVFNPPWTLAGSGLDLPMLLVGIAYAFVGTVLTYAFYMTGLAKPVETSRVPVIASVETVVAALLGTLVFSESMGLWKALGIGLVFCSIMVMNLPARSGTGSAES